ncbi:cysteine-rich receptor-like protein kinase 25 [Dorcoceras hygrometricum]|uniref:Cysteine-rich receptor-like protein kinase 25 n=1 Tax=Dorcoceras hygrometricum TaxID=472368 RepID=A0A2Z7ALF6_9LAMI|nr:cysteine-rich receptor-like protein kinase 25 [Dorcoceras hygrometricum]
MLKLKILHIFLMPLLTLIPDMTDNFFVTISSRTVPNSTPRSFRRISEDTTSHHCDRYIRDEHKFVKYDFQQFKKMIYKWIDDLLESVVHSQAAMESRIVTQGMKIINR